MAYLTKNWLSQHQNGKHFWSLINEEMIGWHWYQLDHMQIVFTSLLADHIIIIFKFYRLDTLTDAQTTVSKHYIT